jgi:sulfite dehydrogenase
VSRRAFVIFGIFVAVFAIGIPLLLITGKGTESGSPAAVAGKYEEGQKLFAENCGTCHTLRAAGADGVVGPNLDHLLGTGTPEGNAQRVENAVESGINGRMPKGILEGEELKQVAAFVGHYAGQ